MFVALAYEDNAYFGVTCSEVYKTRNEQKVKVLIHVKDESG